MQQRVAGWPHAHARFRPDPAHVICRHVCLEKIVVLKLVFRLHDVRRAGARLYDDFEFVCSDEPLQANVGGEHTRPRRRLRRGEQVVRRQADAAGQECGGEHDQIRWKDPPHTLRVEVGVGKAAALH